MAAVDRVECLSNEGEQPELVFVYQEGEFDVMRRDIFTTLKEMGNHGD